MPLPVSASLSLLEAAQFVMEKTGESEARVHDALKEAGLTGALQPDICIFRLTPIWPGISRMTF
jgi:hypothetical protein